MIKNILTGAALTAASGALAQDDATVTIGDLTWTGASAMSYRR